MTSKPTIALVNEDESGKFEGETYNFGKSFVDLVSSDTQYNWQVVSRAVADRAYTDGSVNAVIYLPRDFTADLLTLQALDPKKAEVDYKIENSQNQVTGVQLDNKINGLLHDFNSRIVQMYYSSVATNLASAQTSMRNVVSSQGSLISQLGGNILPPFKTTAESYSSTISQAEMLKSQNTAWLQMQNSFTSSVQKMLEATSQSLQQQEAPLTNFFKTNQEIAQSNVAEANAAINRQFDEDTSFYAEEFKGLYTANFNSLNQFVTQAEDGTTQGVYPELVNQVEQYNQLISEKSEDIKAQVEQLGGEKEDLLKLEQQLLEEFFASQQDISADNYTYDSIKEIVEAQGAAGDYVNAREALADKLRRSFEPDYLLDTEGHNYSGEIATILGEISVDPSAYGLLLGRLVENGSLTQEKADEYLMKLQALRNYANVFELSTGALTVESLPANDPHQMLEKSVSVVIPKGKNGSISLSVPAPATMLVSNKGTTGEYNQPELEDDGCTVSLNNTTYVKEEPVLDAEGDPVLNPDGTPQMQEVPYPCETDVTLTVTYQVDFGTSTDTTVTVTKDDGSGAKNSEMIFSLYPEQATNNAVGQTYFEELTGIFSKIDCATQLINFIYGKPNDDGLMNAAVAGNLGTREAYQEYEVSSVYNSYGNIDRTAIKERLSVEDVKAFQEMGKSNLEAVIDTITALEERIAALNDEQLSLSANLPSDYFAQQTQALQAWYDEAYQVNEATYGGWKTSSASLLEIKPWNQHGSSDLNLYVDEAGGKNIYQMISELMDSTQKSATDTAKNAQAIEDNSNQFEELVKGVNATKASAQKVLDSTGQLLNTGDSELKSSQDYYGNFSGVLANTRTPGVNAGELYDFFAQPLMPKNVTPKVTEKKVEQPLNLLWIPALVGGLGMFLLRKKS